MQQKCGDMVITKFVIGATLKKIFKKSCAWIKKEWKFVTGLAIGIFLMVFSRSGSSLKSVLSRSKEDYKKEIELIESAHKKEIEDRDIAIERYKSSIDQIEKKYEEDKKTLDKKKANLISKVISENSDNPEEITKRIAEITGFKIHLS